MYAIRSYYGRMVGHEHARELTQDVFVRAWQKLLNSRDVTTQERLETMRP